MSGPGSQCFIMSLQAALIAIEATDFSRRRKDRLSWMALRALGSGDSISADSYSEPEASSTESVASDTELHTMVYSTDVSTCSLAGHSVAEMGSQCVPLVARIDSIENAFSDLSSRIERLAKRIVIATAKGEVLHAQAQTEST